MGLDSRDLIEERDNFKEQILDDFNDRFNTELDDFDEIETYLNDEASEYIDENERDDFKSYWESELGTIEDIDNLENTGIEDWDYGAYLIEEVDFEDYVKELLEDTGYIPKDLPSWIEIDWEATANNVRSDYTSVTYKDEDYLVR